MRYEPIFFSLGGGGVGGDVLPQLRQLRSSIITGETMGKKES